MKKAILPILIFLYGCANMVTPSGGKMDEKIPTLTKSNLTPTKFSDDHIKLDFDEYVDIDNSTGSITIQPKHTTFTVTTSAKTIKIKFDSALQKNTTYILDIANGIKDLNEGNKYSFSYIFSTGEEIDTNFINYKITNFAELKNLKIGLTSQSVDSISKLKFDYLYNISSENITIKGLSKKTYYNWIFTDKNNDGLPDEYAPIYYDTIQINKVRTAKLDNWIDSRNIKIKNYNSFTKIFKRINDESTYHLNSVIYIDKDSALFIIKGADSLPFLDLNKELSNKINHKIQCLKTSKEYMVIIDKCGIKNISITDKINYKEDENYFYINSKLRLDSINYKVLINTDTLLLHTKRLQYEELNKISSLKISKNDKNNKVIMTVYENDKLVLIKKIDLKNDVQFYLNPGIYKIDFYLTDSFENISFNLDKKYGVNCKTLENKITLKPNWDEVLRLIFK